MLSPLSKSLHRLAHPRTPINFSCFRFPSIFTLLESARPYTFYLYSTIQLVFIINILIALLPLLKPKDTLSDIPLTPAQRSLLGLPASNQKPTPGSTYATPPRYSRSPATRSVSNTPIAISPLGGSPLSGSPMNFNSSINGNFGSSIGSMGGTPSKLGRESPFSPNQASPLLHKTFSNQRRDSGAGLGNSMFGRMAETPSPGAKASVALNNKWLYEKGRSSQGAGGRLFRD